MIDYTEEELLSAVSATDVDATLREAREIDYLTVPPEKAALSVAKVLLFPSPHERAPLEDSLNDGTAYAELMQRERTAGHIKRSIVLTNWLIGAGRPLSRLHAFYPLYLYNINFGDSRAIIERLLDETESLPPYLSLLCLNLFHQVLGISHDDLVQEGDLPQESARRFNRLFSDLGAIEKWLKEKPKELIYYSGATNTILGFFDRNFSLPSAHTELLRRDAECAIDLGGGFTTSEISRVTGRSFVSADIQHPSLSKNDPHIILLKRTPRGLRIVDTATHDAFVASQDAVEYLPFDVFDTALPEAKSYTLISTGFLTSTIRPQRALTAQGNVKHLGSISISVHGMYRILEPACRGKDVDLFTVQRATTRSYLFKTSLMQWRAGKLVTVRTTFDDRHAQMLRSVRELGPRLMHPSNEIFARFAALR